MMCNNAMKDVTMHAHIDSRKAEHDSVFNLEGTQLMIVFTCINFNVEFYMDRSIMYL